MLVLVEDEPSVRQLSVDALTELGYRVLEVDGAAAALRLIDAHPDIALLFTGYTPNAMMHNVVFDVDVQLIGKPFTIEELAARVREVLDTPQ